MTRSPPQVSITCYVRASVTAESIENIIETLRDYQTKKLVDEFTVTVWPDRICMADYTSADPVLTHYNRFQTWAADNDVSLEPAFTRRQRTTLVSDEAETVLELPTLCLTISVDGELVSVAPHSNERTYTATDALADIESLARGLPPEDRSDYPPDLLVRSTQNAHADENQPIQEQT